MIKNIEKAVMLLTYASEGEGFEYPFKFKMQNMNNMLVNNTTSFLLFSCNHFISKIQFGPAICIHF